MCSSGCLSGFSSSGISSLGQVITIDAIIDEIKIAQDQKQDVLFIAIAGPPGSGKSTLAETLAQSLAKHIELSCCIIPMDGFHFDNERLIAEGMLDIKGAPETFDRHGLAKLIDDLKMGICTFFPTFDRDADAVTPLGGQLPSDVSILLFEGNYLLFNEDGWADLSIEWDASIWLDVPQDVLEARLVQRWLDQGMPKDQALARARSNDLVNAKRIIANALPSTWVIRNENS